MGYRLETLGKLKVTDHQPIRPSPLVLLTFLSLEGAKDRRYLAELFYMKTACPRANLRKALFRLNREGVLVQSEGNRLETPVTSDAEFLQRAAQRGACRTVTELYRGPFLVGVSLAGFSEELKEWVYKTKDTLEATVFDAYLKLIHRHQNKDDLRAAAALLNQGLKTVDAGNLEPSQLERGYKLACNLRSHKLREMCALLGECGGAQAQMPQLDATQ